MGGAVTLGGFGLQHVVHQLAQAAVRNERRSQREGAARAVVVGRMIRLYLTAHVEQTLDCYDIAAYSGKQVVW